MDERLKFIAEHLSGRWDNFSALCTTFGVSRKTGYKWLGRYEDDGTDGLAVRSSAPNRSPQSMAADIARSLVDLRRKHPTWGPRKLLAVRQREQPEADWPAASTLGDLLKRLGLVKERRRRRRASPSTQPFQKCSAPNDTWCIDFKGQFPVGAQLCYPLTMTDAFSRYLLCCDAMPRIAGNSVQQSMERVFREHGMPKAMRSDNGPPFASTGFAGLSRLSAWWVRLGIQLERIEPGKPQQNGRHERFHGSLKRDLAPRESMAAEQRALDAYRIEFNTYRPHEALAMKTPADIHVPSARSFPDRLPELEYSHEHELRRVHSAGDIKWRGQVIYVSEALVGEVVGLRLAGDGVWSAFFGPVLLGHVSDRAPHLKLVRPTWGR